MRTVNIVRFAFITMLLVSFMACERNFDIKLADNEPQLIVEAYINNELPLYNYVILGRSQNFYDDGFENIPVSGAMVTITEGTLNGNTYTWNATTKKRLKEGKLPQYGNVTLPGVYFDSVISNNQLSRALKGTPGKHYLLEIDAEGKHYSSITQLLPVVRIDSLTSGYHYMDEDDDDSLILKARITVHYQDPDTLGNTILHYWRHGYDRDNFGWGGLGSNRFTPGTDELVNGQYIRLTHSNGFLMNDSVSYFMASVERKVFNFWNSFNKARSNGGPFSTPVKLLNTIEGDNVIGCFSGMSLSAKSILVK